MQREARPQNICDLSLILFVFQVSEHGFSSAQLYKIDVKVPQGPGSIQHWDIGIVSLTLMCHEEGWAFKV